MIDVVFFHDANWKIKGYRVAFSPPYDSVIDNQVHGLLLGTKLALQELKAYHCKTDSDDLHEIVVTRANKAVVATLKPLELAMKQLEMTFPKEITVRQF